MAGLQERDGEGEQEVPWDHQEEQDPGDGNEHDDVLGGDDVGGTVLITMMTVESKDKPCCGGMLILSAEC